MLMRLDRDGDGALDRGETPGRLRDRFDRADRDGDGRVTEAELRAVLRVLVGRPGLREPGRRPGGRFGRRPERAPAPTEPARDGEGPKLIDLEGNARFPLDPGEDQASVVIFVTDDCPIANAYAPEINRLVLEYVDGPVRFHLVHVDPDLRPEEARAHAAEYGLTACPVLIDAEHEVVRAVGATTTPEAAVIVPGGEIVYRGRIDDRYADLGERRLVPTTSDLNDAIAAVLDGRPVRVARTEAVGCNIPPRPVEESGP